MAAQTPMMAQYEQIKEKYKDSILMFRLGDFYEMFNDDALTASKELELTLTGRASGGGERAPMCGVPFHSAESYISRLVQKGYKVAICEQMEDPALAKDIVRRDVVRVVTPGTLMDENVLERKKNNFLACVFADGEQTAIAFADVSTGEFLATVIDKEDAAEEVLNEFACFAPNEVIFSPYAKKLYQNAVAARFDISFGNVIDECFVYETCAHFAFSHLELTDEQKQKLTDNRALTVCVGAVLLYLKEIRTSIEIKLCDLRIYDIEKSVGLDFATRRNLEIVSTMRDKEKRGSLLWVLDKTKTAMGGRLLRRWLEKPLINIVEIHNRHESVGELAQNMIAREEISDLLDGVYDLKRIITRIMLKTVTPRDLLSLKESVLRLPEIKEKLSCFQSFLIKKENAQIDPLTDIYELLDSAICDEAPAYTRDGGFIKKGFNAEADEYRSARDDSAKWLEDIQTSEREKTGIKTLRVGYNKVFGYYIEVSKGQSALVPDSYVRKQTLVNGERYITDELKRIENIITGAQDKLLRLELYLFEQIRQKLYKEVDRLKAAADALAVLDVLCSFAEVAQNQGYCMPQMIKGGEIEIKDGRHPVVEKMLKGEMFVPNDTKLDIDDNRMMLITGPNMAGKSTYMRQVALICIMAQAGSFVPAASARLCVVDNIFTRVGAADDLAAGQSTFMVEMTEVSHILKTATKDSLVIFDEVGRGTSTFDGLSIAWAVAEYVADKKKIGAKTLFATHYREMTQMEQTTDGVKNYCVAVKKRGESITFLRKIIRGCADGSYGIEVAALAGVPKKVLLRAREILNGLENEKDESHAVSGEVKKEIKEETVSFDSFAQSEIISELAALDVTTYTPIEALNKLYELSDKAKKI